MLTILLYLFRGSLPISESEEVNKGVFLLSATIDLLNIAFGFLIGLNILV